MTSPIDAAKARHRLADVARRTGIHLPADHGNWTVRCPMPAHGHPDRNPSLRLYLDQNLWACFGCSPAKANGNPRAADVIDWVRSTEGITDWREALRALDSGRSLTNAWAGSPLGYRPTVTGSATPVERPDLNRTSAERVGTALNAAWRYYTSAQLHARGVAYLNSRSIKVQVLEDFTGRTEVGHTPASPNALTAHLRQVGFTDDELVDAALAYRHPDTGAITDFYRQRVLIPVRGSDGRLAGIIGRNIGDPRWPKYKNPPRTHLYDKSVNLYQPLPAPRSAQGRVIVVEGTLDAMAIAVAAVTSGHADRYCPVTQSGRELSPDQLQHALALHGGPLLAAFDADDPGRESSRRLLAAIRATGREGRGFRLPPGSDPASWLAAEGSGALLAVP